MCCGVTKESPSWPWSPAQSELLHVEKWSVKEMLKALEAAHYNVRRKPKKTKEIMVIND